MAQCRSYGDSAVDAKILCKPGKFDDSEEKFAEWSFVTREYVALWQPSLHEMMLKAEKLGEKPIALTDFSLEDVWSVVTDLDRQGNEEAHGCV